MKKVLLIVIPVVLIIFYFTQIGGSSSEYASEIEEYWNGKHDFYRTSQGSPFVQKGVAYEEVEIFTPNPDYKVNAQLTRYSTRQLVTLFNSDGTETKYLKFAKADFKIDDKSQSLLILKALGFGNQYLTAFGDDTSGESTYGGGRYLDLNVGKSDKIVIDFNKSYNPYCAYFPDFTCPLPPRENLLTVAIEAGEKDYKY